MLSSSSSSNNERLSKRVGSIATVYNTLSHFTFVCESLSFLSFLFFNSLIWFIPFSSLRASEPGGGSHISRPLKEKKKVNTKPQQNTCKSVVLELTVALYICLEAGIVQFMLMVCKKKKSCIQLATGVGSRYGYYTFFLLLFIKVHYLTTSLETWTRRNWVYGCDFYLLKIRLWLLGWVNIHSVSSPLWVLSWPSISMLSVQIFAKLQFC